MCKTVRPNVYHIRSYSLLPWLFLIVSFFGNYLLLHLLLPALWQIIICQMADNDISFFYFFSHEEKRAHLHHHELVAQSTSRCLPSLSWTIWH